MDSSLNFCADDFTHLLVNSQRNQVIVEYPRLVLNHGLPYKQKEVLVECPPFGVVPCKALILHVHEVVHKVLLLWPEEVTAVCPVNNVPSLSHIVTCWSKGRRICRE